MAVAALRPLLFILLFFLYISCHVSSTVEFSKTMESMQVDKPCADCNNNNIVSRSEISIEEMKLLRVEYIKSQILQKLRLHAPPRVTRPVLPDILLKEQLLYSSSEEQRDDLEDQFSREDFYAKTIEIVIFPDNTSTHNCYTRDEARPNSCFRFRLTNDVTTRSVTSAELWVYKIGSTSLRNHTYTILEVSPHPRDGDAFSKRVVAIEDSSSSPGWMKFELGPAIRTWSLQHHMSHALEISCSGCEANMTSPVSTEDQLKPLIIVHTDPWEKKSRNSRSLTCSDHTTRCCKKNFKINFSEIGWDHWIIYPLSYSANFCYGSCLADVTASRYYHTTVMQHYIRRHPQNRNISLALCCSPSKLRSLTLIYVDEKKQVYKNTLPNMIVESCNCS